MNIYSFETLDVRFQLMQEEEIPNISASEPQIYDSQSESQSEDEDTDETDTEEDD